MPVTDKFILAIDLGTGGPKVALVSVQGELVDSEFEETRLFLLPGGGAEQSPQEWWQAIDMAAKRLLSKGLVPSADIVAVICTGQWSGTVPVDQEGNVLANAINWMDARGAPYLHQVLDGPLKIQGYAVHKLLKWIQRTGGVPGTPVGTPGAVTNRGKSQACEQPTRSLDLLFSPAPFGIAYFLSKPCGNRLAHREPPIGAP